MVSAKSVAMSIIKKGDRKVALPWLSSIHLRLLLLEAAIMPLFGIMREPMTHIFRHLTYTGLLSRKLISSA